MCCLWNYIYKDVQVFSDWNRINHRPRLLHLQRYMVSRGRKRTHTLIEKTWERMLCSSLVSYVGALLYIPPPGQNLLWLWLANNVNGYPNLSQHQEIWQRLYYKSKCIGVVVSLRFSILPYPNSQLPNQQPRLLSCYPSIGSLINLSKPRWRRQRERHQTKGLISKTIAVHVRYDSLYISMASSA